MRDRAKVFTMALVFVFLISTLTTVSAKEIIVDSNSNGDFIHIQAAINAALLGDKIIVKPGTYVEDITIKKNLTVVSESGNSSDTIIKSANGSDDIFSVWSNSVSIKGFSINGARYAGIHLFGVNNCNITNNNLSNNGCGIDLYMFSSGNTLANNQISNSVTGISLGDSLFNSLRNNSVSNCGSAISIFDSRNNTLRNNLVFNNSEGISLIGESNGNTLTGNIVISNTKTGLHLYGASDNLIHNNYFNNAENVEFEESESTLGANIWNKNKTVGTDVVGGQYLGGNFWAKPDGTGFSQISEDSDRDGICDFYYNISKNEIDYLPLVSLSSPEKPVLPISNESGMKSNFDRIIVKGSSVLPEADFMAFPTSGNAPLYVQFIDLSKNATGWNWNFGDGNTSTAQYPTNTYSKAGKYTVSLTVTNENYTNSKTLDITVTEAPIEEKVPPVASFDAYPTSGNAPLSVQFTDKSTGSPTSWSWDFNNDGIADSSTQSPAYTYNTPGTYVAKLAVSNADGTNSITQNISVYGAPLDEKIPPVASFDAYPTSGNAPLSVQFTDKSTGSPTSWSWDFNNDGIADSSTQSPAYTYNTPGTYVAKLTVSNADGTNSITQNISVYGAPIEEKVPLVANFNANITSGNAPLTVQFTDHSQNATLWSWDFNNDGIADSSDINPIYTYNTPGTYVAKLTVSNADGTNSTTQEISVHEASLEEKVLPAANFNAYPSSGNAPLSVQFTDHSQNATSWSWDFNNDGVADSITQNPVYTYNTPGTYVAKLTVSNVNGTMNKTETITVTDGSSSGGSSSGGSSGGSSHSSSGGSSGGGGAGGSPEPQSNVEVKELSQAFITSGSSVRFDFPNNATSVLHITFNSKKTAGKTTTIVEMLKGKSTLVSQLPSGEVYKSLNIWVGNSGFATPSNIENSVVCFKVEKSWMQGKGINQSSISLNRYSDKKWNSLPTSLQGEDNNYFYFTAQTPGFSPFAITGNSTVKETVTKTQPADTKIQPGANVENVVQNNTASKTVQGSILNSEQKSQNGKSSSLPIFGMICMIALLLVAFLFKVDKKP